MADSVYPIKRIRLLNFHNFVDETIELADHGHLFLLGDNGCGKTTILDAVHYVLTAGKTMEWNSAARLSGSKREGRRVQGIVLRYNLDTGIMNSSGAITYVALEIDGRHGRPLSIGMGLSATALDEKVGFWGFIRECPLADLPLTTAEGDRLRPSSRQEFKQRLGSGHGFYSHRTAYRKDLADRLFGGEDNYRDICRFLAMGKSYREISAGAADYHQLFKSLLPEPRTSLFEQIIESLRSLDESQALLDDLERKLGWLTELDGKRRDIDESREAIVRYTWLGHHFTLGRKEEEERECCRSLEKRQKRLADSRVALAELEARRRDLEERLHDLQLKDSSGHVRQEKHCREELARKKAQLQSHRQESDGLRKELKQREKDEVQAQRACARLIGTLLPELARRAPALPFSITTFLAEVDALGRAEPASATVPSARELVAACDGHIQDFTEENALLGEQLRRLEGDIAEIHRQIEHLQRRSELTPRLPGYEHFENALRSAMLTPRPLFQGLEWAPSVSVDQRRSVEECIGEEILATMLLRPGEYDKARELCTGYPGLRICRAREETAALPEWMRQIFDISASDPSCLLALALEMESSGWQPEVRMVAGKPVLAFRGHERTLAGAPARLIGSDSRQKALAAETAALKKELQRQEQEKKEREKALKELRERLGELKDFKAYLLAKTAELRDTMHALQEAARALAVTRQHGEIYLRTERGLQQEVDALALRLDELTGLIAAAGLANLDQRLKRLARQRQALEQKSDALKEGMGGDRRDLDRLQENIESIRQQRQTLKRQKEAMEEALQRHLEPGTDPAHYILKTRKGQQFKSREAIDKELENARVAHGTTTNGLRAQLNDPEFGGAFRFSYDEENNQLYDYRQQTIAAILGQQTTALREQQEVINDRTRELFKKIIMTDLMQYLRGHVGEMESMVRRINTLLRDRTFGGQRYSFKIRPLDQYQRLINIIKKISPFDPKGEEELEAFFADHREAIIATETGTIPDELDYRNWYRYEMVVSTLGEEGQVMNRRNKSLGSGGEQAVPNYLLILTIAHFMYRGKKTRLHTLLFDEAFYGIDAGRRDQLLGFATDLGLQLFIASPDQDGVRQEVRNSTTILVKKDTNYDVHLFPFHWQNPANRQLSILEPSPREIEISFGEEL